MIQIMDPPDHLVPAGMYEPIARFSTCNLTSVPSVPILLTSISSHQASSFITRLPPNSFTSNSEPVLVKSPTRRRRSDVTEGQSSPIRSSHTTPDSSPSHMSHQTASSPQQRYSQGSTPQHSPTRDHSSNREHSPSRSPASDATYDVLQGTVNEALEDECVPTIKHSQDELSGGKSEVSNSEERRSNSRTRRRRASWIRRTAEERRTELESRDQNNCPSLSPADTARDLPPLSSDRFSDVTSNDSTAQINTHTSQQKENKLGRNMRASPLRPRSLPGSDRQSHSSSPSYAASDSRVLQQKRLSDRREKDLQLQRVRRQNELLRRQLDQRNQYLVQTQTRQQATHALNKNVLASYAQRIHQHARNDPAMLEALENLVINARQRKGATHASPRLGSQETPRAWRPQNTGRMNRYELRRHDSASALDRLFAGEAVDYDARNRDDSHQVRFAKFSEEFMHSLEKSRHDRREGIKQVQAGRAIRAMKKGRRNVLAPKSQWAY